MGKYGKAIVACLVAGIIVAQQKLSHGDLGQDGWIAVLIAVATAVGVYLIPLAPQARWAKTGVAAVLAALQVAATAVREGGLGSDDILLILIAIAGAAGVYVAPATSDGDNGHADVSVGVGPDH